MEHCTKIERKNQTAKGLFPWPSSRHVPKSRSLTGGKFDLVIIEGRSLPFYLFLSLPLFLIFALCLFFSRICNLHILNYTLRLVHCLPGTVPRLYIRQTISGEIRQIFNLYYLLLNLLQLIENAFIVNFSYKIFYDI